MGTNKTGLYNCFSLFHSVATGTVQKEEWSSSSIQQQLTETCHDLQKNFWFLNFYQFSLPSFHRFFILFLYRCTDRNGTKSIQAWKGGDFFFSAGFRWIDCTYRQEFNQLQKNHTHRRRSIRYESITRQSFITFYLYSYVFIFKIFIPYVYTSFFPCDSNLFPISLSFNIYKYIFQLNDDFSFNRIVFSWNSEIGERIIVNDLLSSIVENILVIKNY